jgi:hypothetical protein
MKLLTILLNITLMLVGFFLVLKKGFPPIAEWLAIALVILVFLTPLLNLLYISFWSGESWLALRFKRKAM